MTYYQKLIAILLLCFTALSAMANPFISYTDTGKGEPLVLIHAWPTDLRLWAPQQDGLKAHFRVITVDLWGFGQSFAPNKSIYTMEDYAYQIKQLLDQLHIQKALIGGESMGGYVTLAFLKKYPEHTSGVILSNTRITPDTAEDIVKKENLAKAVLKEGPALIIRDFLPRLFSTEAPADMRTTVETILAEQHSAAISASLLGIAYRPDFSSTISETKVPILIVTGEDDAVIPAKESYIIHNFAKNSRLIVFKQTGHLSNLERAKEWNEAVIRFANDNSLNLSKK